jgi:hypothetical protein
LNVTILRRAPEAAPMVDRLLDPTFRQTLEPAQQLWLSDLVATGLHNAYWLAVGLSVAALLLVMLLPARLGPAQQTQR